MMIIIGILISLSGVAGITATLIFDFNPIVSVSPAADLLLVEIALLLVGVSMILLSVLHRTRR